MKPDNPEVVRAVENTAAMLFQNGDDQHWFHFVLPQLVSHPGLYTCSHTFDPVGRVKSWIVRSRRLFSDHWRDAEAVVLSHRGKKNHSYDVVLKGSDQAYRLDISLKTGLFRWRELDTKQAAELKEALKVAQR